MICEHIQSSLDNAQSKIDHIDMGVKESGIYQDMLNCVRIKEFKNCRIYEHKNLRISELKNIRNLEF